MGRRNICVTTNASKPFVLGRRRFCSRRQRVVLRQLLRVTNATLLLLAVTSLRMLWEKYQRLSVKRLVSLQNYCCASSANKLVECLRLLMWRLSRSILKSRYYGKLNGINITIFWSKCDSISIPYCPRGTSDQHRRSQNGFYTPRESDHAECAGVYISANPITLSAEEFICSTLNIGAKKSNQNRFFL